MLSGFKKFLMRGNVVDLAVAVVMGTAFTAVVNSIVANLIMPLVTAIFGKQDYTKLKWTVNNSVIGYGTVITALITFLAVATAVYFLIVAPLNHLAERRKARAGVSAEPPAESEKELLAEIRDLLRESRAR